MGPEIGSCGREKTMIELKPCPFCGCDVLYFDKSYSYFRGSTIYCPDCDMVFTLDNIDADNDQVAEAWNRRFDNGTVC